MVNKAENLDLVFGALADRTRRDMVRRLARGRTTVGALGAPYPITKGAVSKHVKVLERAGLLKRTVEGRKHHCVIDTVPLSKAERWVEEVRKHWDDRLDALADYLDEMKKQE
ncbi:MAG: metalloregulator ArsR/SmtB family transcription factor [Acidobacteriota bacterium]